MPVSVEVEWHRRDQRLALAGLHLGDSAFVQHHSADDLHVVVPQPNRADRSLPHGGEGFRQDIVKRRAALHPPA